MLEDTKYAALIKTLAEKAEKNNRISESLYDKYDVRRGLRNPNGTGVLVGLTEVGNVEGYRIVDGVKQPDEGRLYYRGYNLMDLVKGFQSEKRFGFEEIAYLLLVGELPSAVQLQDFKALLGSFRQLPAGFTENMILKIPSRDIMNKLQRSVLVLYSDDNNPDSIEIENMMRQSIQLIASFPTIISYGYQAKAHYFDGKSLYIHQPDPTLSTAENLLRLSRPDCLFTTIEAETLDLLMAIHAEHGGGNNSTFAIHVVSSSGTDTYSAISSAVGALKGPKHGGANSKVTAMVEVIKTECEDWNDESKLKAYLSGILDKKYFDGTGLIYGMGHAVYTLSDPRAILLKEKALELAEEKGYEAVKTFKLYTNIENLTKELIRERKGENATICSNVDLYSGFVYEMLNIPSDLFTPLFAASRIAGWCAHRLEQVASDTKIMRPAYQSDIFDRVYTNIKNRT
ncbi:MAG: citrate synthase [Clostridiales bacterium 38-18]|nr:MAG: citrate synthase [Clostridiales bacterium 38-18]